MKQKINFTKMHGLGNDFVIIDDRNLVLDRKQLSVKEISDRHIGIGFDQLLILSPAKNADFFCRIYNSDGSEAEQCGNGLRCIARYVHEHGLHQQSQFTIETSAGIFTVRLSDYDAICIDLGIPVVDNLDGKIILNEDKFDACILSLGNPHAIIKVDSINDIAVTFLGKKLTKAFESSNGINVGFMQVITPEHIKLRTYERGVGETFSCGSNACAAVVAGVLKGWLNPTVKVQVQHGFLQIEWSGSDKNIRLCGPATHVFNGEIWI